MSRKADKVSEPVSHSAAPPSAVVSISKPSGSPSTVLVNTSAPSTSSRSRSSTEHAREKHSKRKSVVPTPSSNSTPHTRTTRSQPSATFSREEIASLENNTSGAVDFAPPLLEREVASNPILSSGVFSSPALGKRTADPGDPFGLLALGSAASDPPSATSTHVIQPSRPELSGPLIPGSQFLSQLATALSAHNAMMGSSLQMDSSNLAYSSTHQNRGGLEFEGPPSGSGSDCDSEEVSNLLETSGDESRGQRLT